MSNDIRHRAVIFDIVGNRIDVDVTAESACGMCKVKGICGMSESEQKAVSVIVDRPSDFEIGEQVVVSVAKAIGMKAVVLAYIVPFLLLLGSLLLLLELGASEVEAGLISLAATALWYGVLWIFRNKISKEIVFKINKCND